MTEEVNEQLVKKMEHLAANESDEFLVLVEMKPELKLE